MSFIDIHAHVLHNLDDGPADVEEALGLLRALAAEGVTTVVATPHVHPLYPTTPEQRDGRLAELTDAATAAGLAIEIRAGGEIDLERVTSYDDAQIDAFALAGGPAVLVEFPWIHVWPLALAPTCGDLRRRGYLPVVAHPERAQAVQRQPDRLDQVIAAGAVCQVTTGSLAGRFGDSARQTAIELLRTRRAHLMATDAHSVRSRGPHLDAARATVTAEFGAGYCDALGRAAEAVLAGRLPTLPEPDVKRRRGLFRR